MLRQAGRQVDSEIYLGPNNLSEGEKPDRDWERDGRGRRISCFGNWRWSFIGWLVYKVRGSRGKKGSVL